MASISGIYQIRNTVNGNVYIGSAVNIGKRWSEHKKDLGNNIHHNRHLQSAWNKYGADCFEFTVIETCFVFALIFREQHYLDALKPAYNIAPKAGSSLGVKHTAETRAKISAVRMGNKNSLGYKHPPELVERFRLSRIGIKRSPETVAKMSQNQKGRKLTQEHKDKLSKAKKGKKQSPQQIAGRIAGLIASWAEGGKRRKKHNEKVV